MNFNTFLCYACALAALAALYYYTSTAKRTESLSKEEFQKLMEASKFKNPVINENGELRQQFYVHFEND